MHSIRMDIMLKAYGYGHDFITEFHFHFQKILIFD